MEKLALPVLIVAFMAWAVSLGGIASLQEACKDTELVVTDNLPDGLIVKELGNLATQLGMGAFLPDLKEVKKGGSWFVGSASVSGVNGFSASILSCEKVYRYYWFIVGFQFAVVIGALYVVVAGALKRARALLIGLFVVATVLYMQSADSFLTAESVEWYKHGQNEHRARTMTAGCIMTAIANCLVIIALGYVDEPASASQAATNRA